LHFPHFWRHQGSILPNIFVKYTKMVIKNCSSISTETVTQYFKLKYVHLEITIWSTVWFFISLWTQKLLDQWFTKSAKRATGGPRDWLKWSLNPYTNQYFVLRGQQNYPKWSAHRKSLGTTVLDRSTVKFSYNEHHGTVHICSL